MRRSRLFGPIAVLVACSSEDAATPPPIVSDLDASADAGGTSDDGSSAPSDATLSEASVNPCLGRRVCDDFEAFTVGAAPGGVWSKETNAGTVAVSTMRAHSGTKSVKFSTTAGQYQQAYLTSTSSVLFPLANNVMYGRMFVFMETALKDNVHWTMLSGVGPVPGQSGVTGFYRYGGQFGGRISANYDTLAKNTDCWDHSQQAVMPLNRWTCITWRFNTPSNELSMAIDGVDVSDAHVVGSGEGCLGNDFGGVWRAPTFTKVQVGWESYQTDQGHVVYIDDVVLDDKVIPCPP